MMEIVSTIVSILALVVAAIVGFVNLKRAGSASDRQDESVRATIIAKLETINTSITEVKTDVRNQRQDMQELRERQVITEQSVKSAHHRIDLLEHQIIGGGLNLTRRDQDV
jgi:hypothetical protein